MLKRIALLGAMAALTIVKPSIAVAQGWDGWGGNCCERRFIPRPIFCCERQFFPRPIVCCERPFIPRPVFCCEERRFFPRREFCCEESRFLPRPFGRPPYYYGDRFAPYAYNWNAGYADAGYGYDWNGGYTNAGYGYNEY
jgi:hypothetical protein